MCRAGLGVQSNAYATRVAPFQLTRLGPDERTLLSCNPKVDFNIPILASISQNGLVAGKLGALSRATLRAWIKKKKMLFDYSSHLLKSFHPLKNI